MARGRQGRRRRDAACPSCADARRAGAGDRAPARRRLERRRRQDTRRPAIRRADLAQGKPSMTTISRRRAAASPRGELTSEKLTEDCLAKIAELNPTLNAFITVTADEALAQARQADKEIAAGRRIGPLHGIPISLKDLIDQKGVPTTAGSLVRKDHVARPTTPSSRGACAKPARCSSARPTCTSSRSARPARTRGSGRRAIRTIHRDRPAARAADRRSRSRPACRSAPSAPTPAARSAFPPPPAASSA